MCIFANSLNLGPFQDHLWATLRTRICVYFRKKNLTNKKSQCPNICLEPIVFLKMPSVPYFGCFYYYFFCVCVCVIFNGKKLTFYLVAVGPSSDYQNALISKETVLADMSTCVAAAANCNNNNNNFVLAQRAQP